MNEQALKARLKQIANKSDRSFNEVWKLLVLERFLARLSRSQYSDRLIFKGGLLLSYYLTIGRETIDIDILAKAINAKKQQIEIILNEICSLQFTDGFRLNLLSLSDLDHLHMNYPGFQARIEIFFGNMRDKFFVDIGVGDVVDPVSIDWPPFEYNENPLFADPISLEVYPVETIFAEKFETLISRGAANSRMKDYHDLLLICRNVHMIDIDSLKNSVENTFKNRGTELKLHISFSSQEYDQIQALWAGHLRGLGVERCRKLDLPNNITDLIEELNKGLHTLLL